MNYPDDSPEWLRAAMDELHAEAEKKLMAADATALGFMQACIQLQRSITDTAESVANERRKELARLTYPGEKGN